MKAKTYLLIYNLVLCLTFTLTGTIFAKSSLQLVNSLIFLPLVFYFSLTLVRHLRANATAKKTAQATKLTSAARVKKDNAKDSSGVALIDSPEEVEVGVPEVDRRIFLKLIGSAGVSLFMLALFTKKAQAAFFGSVPGPGVVALKDASGAKIDPAQHHPTALYKISQVDDASPAYYGFVDKTGAWYIQKEDSSGNYRYVKGTSDFSTNWTNRASLSYDYFDNVF